MDTSTTKEATKYIIKQPSYNTFHLLIHILTIPSPPSQPHSCSSKGRRWSTQMRLEILPGSAPYSRPYVMALHTLPFSTMSASFFQTYPYYHTFSALINILFWTFLTLFYLYYLLFFRQTLCITLTSTGTPSSGLVYWAQLSWTPSLRNNNGLSSPIPHPPPSYLKPVFCASSRSNTISFARTPISGSPLLGLTANPLCSLKALYHVKITALSPQWSNLLSTTLSLAPTPESFAPMPGTTFGAHATTPPHLLPLSHPCRSKPASITLWQFNMQTLAPPSLLNPLEHHFPVLSSLVRVDRGLPCSLVRGIATQIQHSTFSLNAPPFLPRIAVSSASAPSTHTSLAHSQALSLLAISNMPPTISYALCPHNQTLLDW